MKGFVIIPPKQRYMNIAEIHEAYGSRGIVAYSCKVKDSLPEGGFVIAVQDKSETNSTGLKTYQRQLKQQYPTKEPIYYLCVEVVEGSQQFTLVYDNGTGERKAAPWIEFKDNEAETAIEHIPDELLAKALATALKTPDRE